MSARRVPPFAAVLAVALGVATRAAIADDWGAETNVSVTGTYSETGLNHRALARTSDGAFHVVWAERDTPNSTFRIWTRRLVGPAWTAPEMIVDYLPTDPGGPGDDIGAKYPSLAISVDGTLYLFWHDYRVAGIANVEIFTKTRPFGGAWNPARAADVRLTTTDHPETSGDNGYVPVPVASPNGDVHVLWYDFRWDGSHAEIYSKTRPAGGAWDLTPGDEADVRVTQDATHSELVDVDADGLGNLHAVWRSVEAGARVRFARRDATTGAWSAPIVVDFAGTVAGAPCVAVRDDGTVHVVWPDSRDGGRALWTRVRDPAGVWSAERRLTRPADGADDPSMDVAEDGTLHLVWDDGRVSLLNREVFHRERATGAATWDTTGAADFRVSNAAGSSTRPSVIAAAGNVLVTWRDDRDGNREVYARRRVSPVTGVPVTIAAAQPLLVAPNPARSGVRILRGETTRGDVLVFDAAGRLVRRLRGGADLEWDGRDETGRHASAGSYFVRDETTQRSARLVVLR